MRQVTLLAALLVLYLGTPLTSFGQGFGGSSSGGRSMGGSSSGMGGMGMGGMGGSGMSGFGSSGMGGMGMGMGGSGMGGMGMGGMGGTGMGGFGSGMGGMGMGNTAMGGMGGMNGQQGQGFLGRNNQNSGFLGRNTQGANGQQMNMNMMSGQQNGANNRGRAAQRGGNRNNMNNMNNNNMNNMNNQQAGRVAYPQIIPRQVVAFEYSRPQLQGVSTNLQTRLDKMSVNTRQPALKGLKDLKVGVDDSGTLVLQGQAPTEEAARKVEDLVRLEPGVQNVRNEITYPAVAATE